MSRVPLAERLRPQKLSDVIGQDHIIGNDGLLTQLVKNKQPTNLILWGPPGVGKTTLARIIANELEADCIELSAVTAGKKDVLAVVERARQNWNLKLRTVLFVDEIHRFNKSQQDAFLPHVESGLITLIGATTENPSFEIINPLLSRTRVLTLQPLTKAAIVEILNQAIKAEKLTRRVDSEAIDYIAELSGGDARAALGSLETALSIAKRVDVKTAEIAAQKKLPNYDKKGDMHYDITSAFIKSLRGSDVEASLYYMARMLDAGEDPKFIARRMVVFASEDIGLAGNGALSLAVSTFQAVERVGLPEAKYNLFHCAVALARSEKSREVTDLMNRAQSMAASHPDAPVPLHVRNAPTSLMKDLGYGNNYKWQTNFKPNQGFLPSEIIDEKL